MSGEVHHNPEGPQIVEVRTLVGLGVTALMTLLGASGGVFVGRNTIAEDPAAIVTTLEHVRSDVAELRADLKAQVHDLEKETEQLSERLRAASAGQWRRTDHEQWEATRFRPLELRVQAHEGLEGHASGMRAIQGLNDKVRELHDRVRALESGGRR